MANKAVVFLGPSLPLREAEAVLQADYRPPVRRGDMDALLADPPPLIGMIDGEFFQNMAISPKEVLRTLRAGVTVFGASSMGALRAAELHAYGMIGVGEIFEQYRRGQIDADDEVALVFSPLTMEPVSVPLVNMRFALAGAVAAGIIDAGQKGRLLRIARRLYYPDRTYPRLLTLGSPILTRAQAGALADYLQAAPDLKRLDALRLLQTMRARQCVGKG